MENNNNISLYDWAFDGTSCVRKEDELAELFLYLDKSMRFLHSEIENNHGSKEKYCIDSFNPYDIQIVNGDNNKVVFNKYSKIHDGAAQEDSIVRDNIFTSAYLQIGMYTNAILNQNYTEKFLRENFEEFAKNLPNEYVPYYRGVVERNAAVYLSDFITEKSRREYETLQKQLSDLDGDSVSDIDKENLDLYNETVNSTLYSNLFETNKTKGLNDRAFARVLVYPTIVLLCLLIIVVIYAFITVF